MFAINLPTLFLILGITKLLLAFLLLHLKIKIPNIKGMNYWVYGSFLAAAGAFIVAYFPYPAPLIVDFIYSFSLNILVVSGDCFFLAGFWIFKEKPVKKRILYGFPLLSALNVIVFSLFFHVVWIRLSINAFLLFVLYFVAAIELRKSPSKSLNTFFRLNSWIFAFYAVSQLTRSGLSIISHPVNPIASNSITIYLYVINGICMVLLTYNLVLVIMTTLNEELSEQIRTKNKLYAVIAHDLRNPMGDYYNYVSILKKSYNKWDDHKRENWITEMEKMTFSSRFLLENLLNWSKSQLNEIKPQPRIHNLNRFVGDVIVPIQTMADHKRISIITEDLTGTTAYFDADMIAIVLRNLFTNAIKFTPANGSIRISISTNPDKIEVAVADNGIGIENDKLALIFNQNVFSSTYGTESEKGSGFGLFLCKEFVELNRGEIIVKSTPGKGSYFAFTLPASAGV